MVPVADLAAVVRCAAPGGRFLTVPPRVLAENLKLTRIEKADGSVVYCAGPEQWRNPWRHRDPMPLELTDEAL
jgi:hypothetical protein